MSDEPRGFSSSLTPKNPDTIVENIEVLDCRGNGINFQGGSVNVSNALVWHNGINAFTSSQAWSGTLDNAISLDPDFDALNLFASVGESTSSGHSIKNFKSYGVNSGHVLFAIRANSAVNMNNLYFFGFGRGARVSGYSEYAQNMNGFEIMNIEASYSFGNPFDLASIFGSAADLVKKVPSGMNTVGADVSAFIWTIASQTGFLAEIGLE